MPCWRHIPPDWEWAEKLSKMLFAGHGSPSPYKECTFLSPPALPGSSGQPSAAAFLWGIPCLAQYSQNRQHSPDMLSLYLLPGILLSIFLADYPRQTGLQGPRADTCREFSSSPPVFPTAPYVWPPAISQTILHHQGNAHNLPPNHWKHR